ncbi:hypothetical protein TcasGA2_TC033850 [Tribolium castaneum]|uniref:Uncharacterized protein n=1 Tax=Tribolium castaneum TaxID=7070 RepID=A0A139WF32_TRICA|nr:PREDICTED: uncharacterized protein LOC107398307 [Tribolium castaneum]KYB26532.1 hypothetical protein TcasGA2_TC033850 [Tribolium castaneum]|eukprot:XP_015837475.1 PREDICTED: uncharacterized protein LOC107398307 [Tribolium castaneum]
MKYTAIAILQIVLMNTINCCFLPPPALPCGLPAAPALGCGLPALPAAPALGCAPPPMTYLPMPLPAPTCGMPLFSKKSLLLSKLLALKMKLGLGLSALGGCGLPPLGCGY